MMALLMIPVIAGVDYYFKQKAEKEWSVLERRYLGGRLRLGCLHNEGAFMGWLKQYPKSLLWLQASLVAIVTGVTVYFAWRKEIALIRWGFALISAGGISNFGDRFQKGYVVDYLRFGRRHKVYYNLGDLAIFAGALLVVIGQFFTKN